MTIDSVIFYTSNVDTTSQFYLEILGLEQKFLMPGKFAQFKLTEETSLGIKQTSEDREIPGSQTVILGFDSIEALIQQYDQLKVKVQEFHKDLTEESYGTEFSILDPEGNKVQFIYRI